MSHEPEEKGVHEHARREEAIIEVDETIVVAEIGDTVIVEEIIDIEVYAKEKKKPPHAKGYRIRIDKDYQVVYVPKMTGREILALVGKTPDGYLLSQKFHGGRVVPIAADEVVDFRHHGIERFQTLARDPTEG